MRLLELNGKGSCILGRADDEQVEWIPDRLERAGIRVCGIGTSSSCLVVGDFAFP